MKLKLMLMGLILSLILPMGLVSAQDIPLPDLYDRVSQSVVAIEVRAENDFSSFFPTGGLGSGFVYDTEGHIVTNFHVVEDAEQINVSFFDGTLARAEVVGTDPDSDIAVIQVSGVDPSHLQPLVLGDSGQIRVGEDVIAIGNPFGQNWTMTTGIVSALGRANPATTGFSIAQMIQTDAAINPGNSGGPLLNRNGEVIGMNTMIFTETQVSSGVGFAVPVNTIRRVVPELITTGEYQYTWIGIQGGDLNLDVIEILDLEPATRGVLISGVSPNGPADQADLRGSTRSASSNGFNYDIGGDIITHINGTPVNGINELINYLADNTRPGDVVEVTIIRDGKVANVLVKLEARPDRAR